MGRVGVVFAVVGCAAAVMSAAAAATSPQALRAAILHAALAKRSVHYDTVSSRLGARITTVSDITTHRGIQRVSFSRSGKAGHVTTVVVRSRAYVRGDAFALRGYMGFSNSLASRYAGRWVSIAPTSRFYGPSASGVTLRSFVTGSVPKRDLSIVGGTVGATQSRGLRGMSPAGGTLTVYVAPSGTPLPFEAKSVIRGARPVTSFVTMSRWNEPVHVQPPSHATPLPNA